MFCVMCLHVCEVFLCFKSDTTSIADHHLNLDQKARNVQRTLSVQPFGHPSDPRIPPTHRVPPPSTVGTRWSPLATPAADFGRIPRKRFLASSTWDRMLATRGEFARWRGFVLGPTFLVGGVTGVFQAGEFSRHQLEELKSRNQ